MPRPARRLRIRALARARPYTDPAMVRMVGTLSGLLLGAIVWIYAIWDLLRSTERSRESRLGVGVLLLLPPIGLIAWALTSRHRWQQLLVGAAILLAVIGGLLGLVGGTILGLIVVILGVGGYFLVQDRRHGGRRSFRHAPVGHPPP